MHIVVMRLFFQMIAVSITTSYSGLIQCILNTPTYQLEVFAFIIKINHQN